MAAEGTEEGFAAFVHRHYPTLMAFGLAIGGTRSDAEDLVQSALTSAYPKWDRIRPEQALAYLRRAMINAQVSGWRRHRGHEVASDDHLQSESVPPHTDGVEDRLVLTPLLRLLPARQRAALVLRYLCDLPDEEIARVLEVRVATVRSLISRGLSRLRAERPATPTTTTSRAVEIDGRVDGTITGRATRP